MNIPRQMPKYSLRQGASFTIIGCTETKLVFFYDDEPRLVCWVPLNEMRAKGYIPVIDNNWKTVSYYHVATGKYVAARGRGVNREPAI